MHRVIWIRGLQQSKTKVDNVGSQMPLEVAIQNQTKIDKVWSQMPLEVAIQNQGGQSRVPNATGTQPGDLQLKNLIPKLNAYTLNSRQFGTRRGKRGQRLLPTNKHLITDEFYMISCGQKKCNLQLSGQFGGVRQCIERHYGLSKNIVVSAKPLLPNCQKPNYTRPFGTYYAGVIFEEDFEKRGLGEGLEVKSRRNKPICMQSLRICNVFLVYGTSNIYS